MNHTNSEQNEGTTIDVLSEGPWGRSWKHDGILSPDNPLRFTCLLCGLTSWSIDNNPRKGESGPTHTPECPHPYNKNARTGRGLIPLKQTTMNL